jgi:protocatechuate 3,4-dioxygenase alpha subunit
MSPLSASQTVGPYYRILEKRRGRDVIVKPETEGARIVIEGVVRDGAGAVIDDALVEVWQANGAGVLNHPEDPRSLGADRAFDGYGRVGTTEDGRFGFETIKPGSVPGLDGRPQAPHLLVGVYARGVLDRLVTRIYFDDEPLNAEDAILALVPAARRSTLVARRTGDGTYGFDLVLQGSDETVFFDV